MFATYHVRRAEVEDRARLLSLRPEALAEGIMAGLDDRGVIEALIEEPAPDLDQLIASGRYFVAEVNGKVVAGAGWAPQDSLGDVAFIRGVVVHPGHCEATLGRRLVEIAEDAAATSGYSLFLAPVPPAVACLFEQLGYRASGAVEIEMAAGHRLRCRKMWKHAA